MARGEKRRVPRDKVEDPKVRNADYATLAVTYLNIKRCAGGRPLNEGFICPHCGLDPTNGGCNGVEPVIPSRGRKHRRKT